MRSIARFVAVASFLAVSRLASGPFRPRSKNSGPETDHGSEAGPTPRSWRYTFHNGEWWYWLPTSRWVYWRDNRWNAYDPKTYAYPGRRALLRPPDGIYEAAR